MEENKKQHESYGIIEISKFRANDSQFFGSDLTHNNGISITISNGEKVNKLSSDWYYSRNDLIKIELSNSQFIDAITSGMNTSGVPCTIKRFDGKPVEQIDHVEDKKERFSEDMKQTHTKYGERIENILGMLEGDIGKRKAEEIKHELNVLKSHISGNTNYVMTCFNKAMDNSVTEAKHSVSNYIDHKIHSLGIESLRKELNVSIGNPPKIHKDE